MTGKSQAKISTKLSKGFHGISEKRGPEAIVSPSPPLICSVISKKFGRWLEKNRQKLSAKLSKSVEVKAVA